MNLILKRFGLAFIHNARDGGAYCSSMSAQITTTPFARKCAHESNCASSLARPCTDCQAKARGMRSIALLACHAECCACASQCASLSALVSYEWMALRQHVALRAQCAWPLKRMCAAFPFYRIDWRSAYVQRACLLLYAWRSSARVIPCVTCPFIICVCSCVTSCTACAQPASRRACIEVCTVLSHDVVSSKRPGRDAVRFAIELAVQMYQVCMYLPMYAPTLVEILK